MGRHIEAEVFASRRRTKNLFTCSRRDSSTPPKRERHTSTGCLTLAADRVGGANNRPNSKQNSADSTPDLTSDVIPVHLLTQCTPGLGSLLLLSSGKTTSTSILIDVSSSYRMYSIRPLNGTQPEVKEAVVCLKCVWNVLECIDVVK